MRKSQLLFIALLAVVIFVPLFTFRQLGFFDFWWWMSSNLVLMISLSLSFDTEYRDYLKKDFQSDVRSKLFYGIVSAVALYALFFIGNYMSRWMFDFAGEGIQHVYDFKGNADAIRVFALMLLVIGPGEEIFWRGVLQRQFMKRWGDWPGFILGTLIYTGVHVFTGNIMLILAALVAGLFWGWMYMKYRSMLANVVSHTLWDISVFLLFPFN